MNPADLREQLTKKRLLVDFDTYDVTVDELLRRVMTRRISIAPVYQRQFRWDVERQSSLIESVFIGVPVPPLFMATNQAEGMTYRWEVVDGLQRLLTLTNFAGTEEARGEVRLPSTPLSLKELEKLTTFEGHTFDELPSDVQAAFLDRSMRIVVLNDKSDLEVRYDLFERLNTGGIELTPQEIRECVYRGEFMDLLGELTSTDEFRQVVRLPQTKWKDGTPEDFVLRFFAFHERYKSFVHSVKDFLDAFTQTAYLKPKTRTRHETFRMTFAFLAASFPNGLVTRKGATPVNLFEGVSVGAALALAERPTLTPSVNPDWVHSPDLKAYTTGATNSRSRVAGRIEYCRDHFLSNA